MIDVAVDIPPAPAHDDLIDDGLLLYYRDEPDPDMAWKASLYDQNSLKIVRHESAMSDAGEMFLDLLRRCGAQLDRHDYRIAMRTHFDLVYPRAVLDNDIDNIVREVEAKRNLQAAS